MNRSSLNNPPRRLIESADFGPMLRKAAALSVDEERLQKNWTVLISRLNAESSFLPRGSSRFFLLLRRPAIVAAFAAALFFSASAAAVLYFKVVDLEWVNDDNEKGKNIIPKKRTKKASNVRFMEKDDSPTPPDTNARRDTDVPSIIHPRSRGRRPVEKVSPDSTLDEQVRLFNKAKALLASGDFDLALKHLNQLKQRYPSGPLYLESKELTAHVLAGLHRYNEASQTVKALIRAKIPTRKKAQLFRFLGDLQVKKNSCDNAVESYRRALGLGLSDAESEAAKAGIRKCVL
jgi:TolA-binding protein